MANEKRLIDVVDEAIKKYAKHGNIVKFISDVRFAVINAPTVDAVEVVRCKDCKSLEITGCYGECRKLVRIVKPWDFCSYGERR